MARIVAWTNQSKRDAAEIYSYIFEQRPSAAERFLELLEGTLAILLRDPLIGRLIPFTASDLANLRRFPLRSPFQEYLVFYFVTEWGISVVRIIHGARDLPTLFSDGD